MYSGLRTQDLQEAKDQLLVETSDMLHIPLFTAEALLRDNGKLPHSKQSFVSQETISMVDRVCQVSKIQTVESAMLQAQSEPGAFLLPWNFEK